MMETQFNYTNLYTPSKKDILLRLFNDGHITAEELILLSEGSVIQYIPQAPQQPIAPYIPTPFPTYPEWPYTVSMASGTISSFTRTFN